MGASCSCPDCRAHQDPEGYDCPAHGVQIEAVDRLRAIAEKLEQAVGGIAFPATIAQDIRDIADLIDN